MKMKEKGKQVTVDILVDNETAYLTDYNAIQRVSLNKLVFTHGHSVSNQSIVLFQEQAHIRDRQKDRRNY